MEAAACQKLRKDVKQHINDRGRSEQEQPHLRVCAASELLRRLDPDGVDSGAHEHGLHGGRVQGSSYPHREHRRLYSNIFLGTLVPP